MAHQNLVREIGLFILQKMGLFRIREQGDMESGLLVPVWFITGEYRHASHPEDVHLNDSFTPIAVINAIDGSIIDVMNGY